MAKFLIHALPFLLPFVLYALWVAMQRRRSAAGSALAPAWTDTPWYWLAASGLVLVVVGLFAMALLGGDDVGGTYVPPRYVDGEVVPAEVR